MGSGFNDGWRGAAAVVCELVVEGSVEVEVGRLNSFLVVDALRVKWRLGWNVIVK